MTKKKKERIKINGEWFTLKSNGKPGVKLTRNAGWVTESVFFGMIRSALRNATRFWKPKVNVLEANARAYRGDDKRIKKEYKCNHCKKWHVRAKVEVNHVIACGSLKSFNDLPGFCERLFVEDESLLEVLCVECHKKVSKAQREAK